MTRRLSGRPGLTLIETTLSISVGLAVVGASVIAYYQVSKSSKFAQAKTMVGTIQTNVGMDKFRLGVPAPLTTTNPANSPATYGITLNMDSVGKPYWPNNETAGQLPIDPITGQNTVLSYSSNASPTPLVDNAPSASWDNPCFASTGGPSPGYGNGGWLYDTTTGAFRINLSNQQYPEHKPGSW